MALRVIFAVYGALRSGDKLKTEAAIVTAALQSLLDSNSDGIVRISNSNLGGDPARGVQKHFAAIVDADGKQRPFACVENQTIDFFSLKPPASVDLTYRMGPFGISHAGGSGTVRFRGTLLNSTSSAKTRPEGVSSFSEDDHWTGTAADAHFFARSTVGKLKLGRWRISAESPPGSPRASCEVDLREHGKNRAVNFQENAAGCARGINNFPA